MPEPGDELKRTISRKGAEKRLCPGDVRLQKRQVEGVVTLTGAFLESHRREIINLVRRVAREARKRKVSARIFEVVDEGGKFTIETTDEHLAERMGKEVEKAFKGELVIKWQEKDTFARVAWRRD